MFEVSEGLLESTARIRLSNLDTLAVSRLLASAAAAENPDLILTGLQSDDLGYGQTGVVIAERGGEERHERPRETRVGRWMVPARGTAASGCVDHPVRYQQAALCHFDGH